MLRHVAADEAGDASDEDPHYGIIQDWRGEPWSGRRPWDTLLPTLDTDERFHV
jgi:hypothetical protein